KLACYVDYELRTPYSPSSTPPRRRRVNPTQDAAMVPKRVPRTSDQLDQRRTIVLLGGIEREQPEFTRESGDHSVCLLYFTAYHVRGLRAIAQSLNRAADRWHERKRYVST